MSGPVVQLLTFELGGQQFGVRSADVEEVARAVTFARLPKAPEVVEGVVNFRGRAIPVLNIRARFGLPSRSMQLSDHLVVARAGVRTIAIRVDRVLDLPVVPKAEIDESMAITLNSRYVAGIAKLRDEIVLIHDLATFLSAAEAAELDNAVSLLDS
jgi:purine-binding chemotaxis protein CheW